MSDPNNMSSTGNAFRRTIDVIEPNTTRVLDMRRKKQEQERINAQKRMEQQKIREDQKKRMKNLQMLKKHEQQEQHSKMMEEQRRRIQQEQQSTRLVGKFGHMINDLNTNTSNLQFTISGLDLRPTQVKVLLSNVQNNSSLKGLTMCRKQLTDVEGIQISERLTVNQYLQRLELEGNDLGPQTLKSLAKLLKVNQTIRLLDLQGNNLIKRREQAKIPRGVKSNKLQYEIDNQQDPEKDYEGIYRLVESLKENETILSINLNNCNLNKRCSRYLSQLMKENSTIIILDVENNPQMSLEDVIFIQDQLVKNKQQHDDERYMEFIERKRMRREEDISGVLLLNKQTKKLRTQAIQLNIRTKKEQLDQDWQEFLQKQELARQKQIVKMEKEAGAKKGKKKKK